MRRQYVFQIVIPTQLAHDLGDRQFGKRSMGLQTECQQIGKHLDQQCRVQTIPLQLHRTNMKDRFEHLPETFDEMMLLPNVPDFRTPHRDLTKIHQIIAARCAFAKKEQNQRSKGGCEKQ